MWMVLWCESLFYLFSLHVRKSLVNFRLKFICIGTCGFVHCFSSVASLLCLLRRLAAECFLAVRMSVISNHILKGCEHDRLQTAVGILPDLPLSCEFGCRCQYCWISIAWKDSSPQLPCVEWLVKLYAVAQLAKFYSMNVRRYAQFTVISEAAQIKS